MTKIRRPLIAGNWKMNGMKADGLALARDIASRLALLAKSLENDRHDPQVIAGFLQRSLFTMFAEDVGLDAMGRPTRSAVEISKGGVLPFGGHKGYGLSFMIQALGLLAGSKRRHGEVFDFGYLFVVFTPDLLMPAGQFKQQLAELVTKIKAMPRQPGVDEIRIPSERAFRERELRTVEGVLLERRVYEALLAMGSA